MSANLAYSAKSYDNKPLQNSLPLLIPIINIITYENPIS